MREIHVSEFIRRPPDAVFAALAEHPRFLEGPGLRCRVIQPGNPDHNGDGAVREVRSGALRFVERISAYDPPRGYDYLVIGLSRNGRELPFQHERGWLVLTAVEGGTRVDWRSRFSILLPLVGGLLERYFERQAGRGFSRQLRLAKARLEANAPE